jgi:hypothetical protein
MNEYTLGYGGPSNVRPEVASMVQGQTQPTTGKNHVSLINTLYKAKEDMHLSHNVQKSKDHSVHTALGDIYTTFDDMIDSFVESIFGIYGPGEIAFSACACAEPVAYLKALYDTIEKERKFYKESWIQNDIDMFQKEIALTLYKLQYVKSNP